MISFSSREHPPTYRPWQELCLEPVTIHAGWYVLRVSGSGAAVCLQLRETRTHSIVELSATTNQPAYLRLSAGTYAPRLIQSVRPGHTDFTGARLEVMTTLERAHLFAGRFAKAVRNGASLSSITQMATRAVRAKGTFGVRAASGDGLGALTRADQDRAWSPPTDTESRLARLARRPQFRALVRGGACDGTELNAQTYPCKGEQGCDWTLVLEPGERLTSDALLLFAEAIAEHPALRVVVADRWQAGQLISRVAFDPLLYAGGLPTPYVIRNDVGDLLDRPWKDQASAFGALGVPVAAIDHPPLREILPPPPAPNALVSIIIPTRDKAEMLERTLKSLALTTCRHEVIIVDNGSVEPVSFDVFERVRAQGGRVLRDDGPFNFSRLSNAGAEAALGDYLVFMNNDVELISDALTPMTAYAALPDAGAIGARLLYSDGSLQHGGVALGLTEVCGHLGRHMSTDAQAASECLRHTSLRAAVTGALLCVARSKFEAVGGFDEDAFPVTLNDVDLCLRLSRSGWFSIYCAEAQAWHPEGSSRGEDIDESKRARRLRELDAFVSRWAEIIDNDPWLPASISRASETCRLR